MQLLVETVVNGFNVLLSCFLPPNIVVLAVETLAQRYHIAVVVVGYGGVEFCGHLLGCVALGGGGGNGGVFLAQLLRSAVEGGVISVRIGFVFSGL